MKRDNKLKCHYCYQVVNDNICQVCNVYLDQYSSWRFIYFNSKKYGIQWDHYFDATQCTIYYNIALLLKFENSNLTPDNIESKLPMLLAFQ
jgi:hypothetical protein